MATTLQTTVTHTLFKPSVKGSGDTKWFAAGHFIQNERAKLNGGAAALPSSWSMREATARKFTLAHHAGWISLLELRNATHITSFSKADGGAQQSAVYQMFRKRSQTLSGATTSLLKRGHMKHR